MANRFNQLLSRPELQPEVSQAVPEEFVPEDIYVGLPIEEIGKAHIALQARFDKELAEAQSIDLPFEALENYDYFGTKGQFQDKELAQNRVNEYKQYFQTILEGYQKGDKNIFGKSAMGAKAFANDPVLKHIKKRYEVGSEYLKKLQDKNLSEGEKGAIVKLLDQLASTPVDQAFTEGLSIEELPDIDSITNTSLSGLGDHSYSGEEITHDGQHYAVTGSSNSSNQVNLNAWLSNYRKNPDAIAYFEKNSLAEIKAEIAKAHGIPSAAQINLDTVVPAKVINPKTGQEEDVNVTVKQLAALKLENYAANALAQRLKISNANKIGSVKWNGKAEQDEKERLEQSSYRAGPPTIGGDLVFNSHWLDIFSKDPADTVGGFYINQTTYSDEFIGALGSDLYNAAKQSDLGGVKLMATFSNLGRMGNLSVEDREQEVKNALGILAHLNIAKEQGNEKQVAALEKRFYDFAKKNGIEEVNASALIVHNPTIRLLSLDPPANSNVAHQTSANSIMGQYNPPTKYSKQIKDRLSTEGLRIFANEKGKPNDVLKRAFGDKLGDDITIEHVSVNGIGQDTRGAGKNFMNVEVIGKNKDGVTVKVNKDIEMSTDKGNADYSFYKYAEFQANLTGDPGTQRAFNLGTSKELNNFYRTVEFGLKLVGQTTEHTFSNGIKAKIKALPGGKYELTPHYKGVPTSNSFVGNRIDMGAFAYDAIVDPK